MTVISFNRLAGLFLSAALFIMTGAEAAPVVSRLTPPSRLFSSNDPGQPITSRFLRGQLFDLQATIQPDAGQTISSVQFLVDGDIVPGTVTLTPATAAGLPANTVVASLRAFSVSKKKQGGIHILRVQATQSDSQQVSAEGNFEIVDLKKGGHKAQNVIIFIGDGLGIAHRTAARIMSRGVSQGKSNSLLAMDQLPVTGLVSTHSLNSIVTDSSPGAACYSTGNKGNNNQHGVFPDDTTDNFDNPRIESIGEYLKRTKNKSLGIVTTSDVFDATPGAFGSHTQSRSQGTGIVDQYLDDRNLTGLDVLLGGGRKWFLPDTVPGSARSAANDYVLPADIVAGWGAAPGVLDPARDLIADFQSAGYAYVADNTQLQAVSPGTTKLLGLFALSNMNIALDKITGRRGNPAIVNDYGFPDQPMLDEMTEKALEVLNRNPRGFVLMVEAASIDKQAHNMDSERWILDTIEFDHAIAKAREFSEENPNTLIVVVADHECAGVNIIGGSRITDAELTVRANSGGGADQLRAGVVGTYEAAGFPRYLAAPDGYPETTDIDYRMLIGYAANGERYEDWKTNPQPLRDSQQPFNNVPPLNTYPNGPLNRDTAGNFLVVGQIADSVAAHTASDIPVSASGPGEGMFTGVMDNTDVFFKVMQAIQGTR